MTTTSPIPPAAASVGYSYAPTPNGVEAVTPTAPELAAALTLLAELARDESVQDAAANPCDSLPLLAAFATVAAQLPGLQFDFNAALAAHAADMQDEIASLEASAALGKAR